MVDSSHPLGHPWPHDPTDRPPPCPWFLCNATSPPTAEAPTSKRWENVLNRFSQELMPDGLIASINQVDPDQLLLAAHQAPAALILWVFDQGASGGQKIASGVYDVMMAISQTRGGLSGQIDGGPLQIVACSPLSVHDRLSMAELGIEVFLEHPEEFQRWGSLIQGHFARSVSHLD